MEDRPIELRLETSSLSDEELEILSAQAEPIGVEFLDGRHSIAQIFLFIHGAAQVQLENRKLGQTAVHVAVAEPDATAPLSHQATDLGYAIARMMPMVDDDSSPPAVRTFWNRLIHNLALELRRRGPPA